MLCLILCFVWEPLLVMMARMWGWVIDHSSHLHADHPSRAVALQDSSLTEQSADSSGWFFLLNTLLSGFQEILWRVFLLTWTLRPRPYWTRVIYWLMHQVLNKHQPESKAWVSWYTGESLCGKPKQKRTDVAWCCVLKRIVDVGVRPGSQATTQAKAQKRVCGGGYRK